MCISLLIDLLLIVHNLFEWEFRISYIVNRDVLVVFMQKKNFTPAQTYIFVVTQNTLRNYSFQKQPSKIGAVFDSHLLNAETSTAPILNI